ncbi:AsmA-like C-terminal domain-containing protein [Devosia aquimaris]|uniref:AsmA-like C-terminal domain-containing protein n=1 Tax=Devosia aquimaris TaxID=2866214 RepID=UPI001CD0FB4B|nr:AsmA-like C-terminal domain-containing protein [Devosia sp. CJK-A8-3]
MSASILPADTPIPPPIVVRRPRARHAAKLAVWILGIPAVLLVVLFAVLLVTPVRLPFGSDAAQSMVRSALPPTSSLSLGEMSLALEDGVWPVIQFSPVVYADSKTGAKVSIAALEIGFSPARALFGQPGATVTIVRPHVQMVQDLFGPRLTSLELVEDPADGTPIVRVQEGEEAFPAVNIGASGIDLTKIDQHAPMRSDNDWLIYNLEATEQGIADLVAQTAQGRFSRLRVRDGIVGMSDSVYGLFRRFENIDLEIGPSANLRDTQGSFSASLGGRTMAGGIARTVDETGAVRIEADVTNIDFAAFLPFIDDPTSMAALRGAGSLSIEVNFARSGGKLVDGRFKVDLTGLDLRLEDSYFPIASSILDINWSPAAGQFTLEEGALQIGNSSAKVSGVFAMGLDASYGPTVGLALKARDVVVQPNDMDAPAQPLDSMEFTGWSAPLYGALGIDALVARKGDAVVEAKGRVDMLQAGLGLDLELAGQGLSADDFKRLWPYTMARESRDWVVANVTAGTVQQARMAFKFPVGTIARPGEADKAVPPGAIAINLVGTEVSIRPTVTMAPIAMDGEMRVQISDNKVTISAGGGTLPTKAGDITVTDPAVIIDSSVPGDGIVEVSGDIAGGIPAILALVDEQQPGLLATADLPLDLKALSGVVDAGLVATVHLPAADSGEAPSFDYVFNGNAKDFASKEPIEKRMISNGQLAFSASQDGYQLGGTADIDGIPAQVEITGTPTTDPVFRLSSTVDVAGLAKMGFDASTFLSGSLRFVAQPMRDGSLKMAVDLENAGLDIKDLGISKPAGTPGTVSASIRQNGEVTTLGDIALSFGTVRLEGALEFHAKDGLVAADFSRFALADGDNAQVAVAPIRGGFAVRVRGSQLDLRPVLKRFFSIEEGRGGVQTEQFNQTISLDVQLERATGFYATTAFKLGLDMLLSGSDMRRVNLTTTFSDANSLSVTTNPASEGRTLSVAFNDAGTILRFLGVYSRLVGGTGSLVLTTDGKQDVEAGQLLMRSFAIVDEDNVVQVLGNRSDSLASVAQSKRLDFDAAQVDFQRSSDRVQITNAILTGPTVGGTLRGFIYTAQRQYDLTGTYVPLFGLNSVFQKIPLLGPILGGRDGEGLVGVTFAVNGPLENPQFRINPLSVLVPGVFRELFEFRAKALPAAQ